MARSNRCNELISKDQRELVLKLFTTSHKTYAEISEATLIPIDKIKVMTSDMERPERSAKLTTSQRTELLMGWTDLVQDDAAEKEQSPGK